MNLPAYEALPAPLWIITALHLLTFTLHFVAMNFVVGSLLFLLFGRMEGGTTHPVARKLIKLLPSAMAATVTLGVAPLLFLQLVYPGAVYSASIASGWLWLLDERYRRDDVLALLPAWWGLQPRDRVRWLLRDALTDEVLAEQEAINYLDLW